MPEENKLPDWERIEADYRAGVLSLREIAAQDGKVNHVAIARRAKKEGWTQDLSARIKAKAEELVTKQAVTKSVTPEQAVTDRQIVEANAQAIATVRLAHRKDINRARSLAMSLLIELETQTGNADLLEALHDAVFPADEDETKDQEAARRKRLEVFERVTSLAGRTDTIKKLSDTLKNLIVLEREAYGLKAEEGEGKPASLGVLPSAAITRAISEDLESEC
jgi:hypothetical protein